MTNPFFVNPMGGVGGQVAQQLTGLGQQFAQQRELEMQQTQTAERQQQVQQLVQRAFAGDDEAIEQLFAIDKELAGSINSEITRRAGVQTAEQQEALNVANRQFLRDYFSTPEAGREELLSQYANDPEFAMLTIDDEIMGGDSIQRDATAKMIAQAVAPDMYQEFIKPQEQEKRTTTQKEYAQAVEQGFEGSLIEYQRAVSEDPATDLEMLKLRAQIAGIEQQNQQREQDRLTAERLKDENTRNLVTGIDRVIGTVDRAMTEADGLLATGFVGQIAGQIAGTPAYNLQRRVETIKANLAFDALQQMRAASPTGGALGAVSERELNLLESSIENLDPGQGAEVLKQNLANIRDHYNKWKQTLLGVNPYGDNDIVGKVSPVLGRPITQADIDAAIERGYTMEEITQRLQLNAAN